MIIDVTDLENKITYNARSGIQTLKVVEVLEKLDEARQEYLHITFINQWGEFHREKFYPTKHRQKLYELACAFGDAIYKDGGQTEMQTSDFVGNYFSAILTNVPLSTGEVSDALYIRQIRVSPKRRDTTGSWSFKRPRKKEVIETKK